MPIPLSKRRFDALAGYTRQPFITQIVVELAWLATADERVLGVVTHDQIDDDFGWVALARDERLRYRAVGVDCSLADAGVAKAALSAAMDEFAASTASTIFPQGDVEGTPVDFLSPVVPDDRLNPTFRVLLSDERYSPARDLVAAMMRFYEDVDGNFIEQFQTTAFDARLWELYLFATFNELGFARSADVTVPDFVLTGIDGRLAVEATSANPPNAGPAPHPETEAEFTAYLQDYVPIKLARALKRKLNKKIPYWSAPELDGIPFVLAVQDFHGVGTMRLIVPAATEYVFGVRHGFVDGNHQVERITEHRFGETVEPSGFFRLPGAENVSAVIVNPQGTITKFNRIGYLAGFGNPQITMIRSGVRRGERDQDGPMPKPFVQEVHAAGYDESWIEGMVVLHNPNARIPLDPELLPGAAHEFLREDGRIMSMLPEFHPLFSQTAIGRAGGAGRHHCRPPTMRKEDIPPNLTAISFDFFYWFSRFEFALKENKYLHSHQVGVPAEPGWDAFVKKWKGEFVTSAAAALLLELKPHRQIVGQGGDLAWAPVGLQDCKSDLAKVVRLLKTTRNNLFHGGKHGAEGWDDPARSMVLLSAGKSVLDELARMAGIEADYTQYY